MLKIEVDISSLNPEQREAVAGFLMTFPANSNISETLDLSKDKEPQPKPEEAFGVSNAGPVLVIPPPATEVAAIPPAPVTPGSSQLDKDGLPWDERIHAGSKSVTADGLWRKKRGVEDATVSEVEAELRALMNIPAPLPTVAQAFAGPVAAVPPPPAAVTTALVPPVAVEAPVDPRQTFVALVGRASTLIQSGKLTQAELQAICASVGVPSLPMLANRLDLVPSVNQLIDSTLASK